MRYFTARSVTARVRSSVVPSGISSSTVKYPWSSDGRKLVGVSFVEYEDHYQHHAEAYHDAARILYYVAYAGKILAVAEVEPAVDCAEEAVLGLALVRGAEYERAHHGAEREGHYG